jgi:uncharacterized phage protein (TIGR02218 family)
MIDASPDLITHMEGARVTRRFDLYTLALTNGTVLRYTNADDSLTLLDGRIFVAGPLITRDRTRVSRGIEVDTMTVSLHPRPIDALGGVPLLQAARSGALRGCRVRLEWAFYTVDLGFKGTMVRFIGSGSPTNFEAGVIELAVRSELQRLMQQMPRDVYQPRCLNQVFDGGCGLDRMAFRVDAAVTGTPTRSGFGSGLGQAAGYFEQGVVLFTTGANAGVQRTVRSFGGGAFTFALPFPSDIAAGDTFMATPGCDGTMATCSTRYSNLIRFRGQPFIPAPEVAT